MCNAKKGEQYFAGVVLLVCAVGTYQMFFITGPCIFVTFMIKRVLEGRQDTFKDYMAMGFKYICILVTCIIIYVAITKLLSVITGIPLSNYKNIDRMGIVGFGEYVVRMGMAYVSFFNPNIYVTDIPYPNICIALYWIIIFLIIIMAISHIIRMLWNKEHLAAIMMTLLIMIYPLVSNFIFVLSGTSGSLQYYSHVFLYVLFVLFLENINLSFIKENKCYVGTAIFFLFFLNIAFCRLSNTCYIKANLLQEHAISYFETLNARIQMIPGYTASTPVVFIEPRNKQEIDIIDSRLGKDIKLIPYQRKSIINDYQWINFTRIWCGFFPIMESGDSYEELDEVKNMPIYPDDGSIKMIDDVIVVKFNELMEQK